MSIVLSKALQIQYSLIRPSASGGFQMLRTSEVKKVNCECFSFTNFVCCRPRTPLTRIGMTSYSLRMNSMEETKPWNWSKTFQSQIINLLEFSRIEIFDDDGKKGPDGKDKLLGTGYFSLKELEASATVRSPLQVTIGSNFALLILLYDCLEKSLNLL